VGLEGTQFESIVSSQSLASLLNSLDGSVQKDEYAEGGGEAPADGNLDFVSLCLYVQYFMHPRILVCKTFILFINSNIHIRMKVLVPKLTGTVFHHLLALLLLQHQVAFLHVNLN